MGLTTALEGYKQVRSGTFDLSGRQSGELTLDSLGINSESPALQLGYL